ncbi:YpjP family protein [Calidifontibacillus erzurumensis]|uniref:YpjP family protein n=1 Tax=Calidifontibacillus erzurumensis TaxID=2741433 RepID=A0A8J8GFU9_9BACI|nr:YpjP family protein [Calidifontibacillus erzurumensis]NSL51013.1 YpjP family protein [Calidifontibacillus erzurumensis]
MKLWIRKLAVTAVTILTFGTIVPQLPVELDKDIKDVKDIKENSGLSNQNDHLLIDGIEPIEHEDESEEQSWQTLAPTITDYEKLISSFTAYSLRQAEQQSMMKFGESIGNVIGDEFKQVILPKIEEAISEFAEKVGEDDLRQLAITEKPASGLGEKIFHIYHDKTGKDLMRFHVRRDHPPKEGYWFNFHYHTYEDQFMTHHDLGSIYWDKNTPPHWS